MNSLILGIETSCDDSSLCLLETTESDTQILELATLNQDKLLARYGGVVPELSSREHVNSLAILSHELKNKYDFKKVNYIAVTTHPGLIGPLLTGINVAKTLSLFLEKPIIGVNHLFAHLEAIHLTEKIQYPYLGLLVSGGHTAFFLVKGSNDFTLLGSTIDDAAGEAFDKGGKLLGLGYPAGAKIDKLAQTGDESFTPFPISRMPDRPGKISYSGLKTALRVYLEKNPSILETNLNDVCASYQKAITDTLVLKTKEIIEKVLNENLKTFSLPIVIGGGVACNSNIRVKFQKTFKQTYFVAPAYCADNAAMIAFWASKNLDQAIAFPNCLSVEPQSRFIPKSIS